MPAPVVMGGADKRKTLKERTGPGRVSHVRFLLTAHVSVEM